MIFKSFPARRYLDNSSSIYTQLDAPSLYVLLIIANEKYLNQQYSYASTYMCIRSVARALRHHVYNNYNMYDVIFRFVFLCGYSNSDK